MNILQIALPIALLFMLVIELIRDFDSIKKKWSSRINSDIKTLFYIPLVFFQIVFDVIITKYLLLPIFWMPFMLLVISLVFNNKESLQQNNANIYELILLITTFFAVIWASRETSLLRQAEKEKSQREIAPLVYLRLNKEKDATDEELCLKNAGSGTAIRARIIELTSKGEKYIDVAQHVLVPHSGRSWVEINNDSTAVHKEIATTPGAQVKIEFYDINMNKYQTVQRVDEHGTLNIVEYKRMS